MPKQIIKYTVGVVVQVFDVGGKLLRQNFHAENASNYEQVIVTDDIFQSIIRSKTLSAAKSDYCNFYSPFDMVQPNENQ